MSCYSGNGTATTEQLILKAGAALSTTCNRSLWLAGSVCPVKATSREELLRQQGSVSEQIKPCSGDQEVSSAFTQLLKIFTSDCTCRSAFMHPFPWRCRLK